MPCSRGCCATQGEHFRSLRFLSAPTVVANQRDRTLSRDLAAYKSLIDQGVEPAKIDGCDELVRRDAPAHVIENRPPEGTYADSV